MIDLIKECAKKVYDNNNDLVLPTVKPGFLRHRLPEKPPEQGNSIEYLI